MYILLFPNLTFASLCFVRKQKHKLTQMSKCIELNTHHWLYSLHRDGIRPSSSKYVSVIGQFVKNAFRKIQNKTEKKSFLPLLQNDTNSSDIRCIFSDVPLKSHILSIVTCNQSLNYPASIILAKQMLQTSWKYANNPEIFVIFFFLL